MKLEVNALSFNIKTQTSKKTKKTSVISARNNQGQSCRYDDDDFLFWAGLFKKSIPFNNNFDFTLGKSGSIGSIHANQELHILTSLFDKIHIRSNVADDIIEIVDQQYAISLIRLPDTYKNAGTHTMKLFSSDNFKYKSVPTNENCIKAIIKELNLNNNSAWCVTDINIVKDVLIFSILVLDAKKPVTMLTSQVGEEMERFRQMLKGKQHTMTLLDYYKLLSTEDRIELYKKYCDFKKYSDSYSSILTTDDNTKKSHSKDLADCVDEISGKRSIFEIDEESDVSKIYEKVLNSDWNDYRKSKKTGAGNGEAGSAVGRYKEFLEILNDSLIVFKYTKTLQQIIFGAPGTGKSYSINQTIGDNVKVDIFGVEAGLAKEKDNDKYIIPDKMIFRTTFHPEYDYAQFVGCYKPIVVDEDGKEVTYQFVPQVFTDAYVEAWNNPNKPVFLVIEEINRGNCAQIFGDIFQLLDRNEDGESEYSIQPDKDLQKYLSEKLGINDPNVDESIKNGEALLLPKNFNILATMNTSDQSLYPMDSAFKRRWDWKYTPTINKPAGKSNDFKIYLGDNDKSDYCNWIDFIKAVNQRIKDATKSEDKQLGEYFIKDSIFIDKFISKVMFYLWTDVCKENYSTKDNFFRTAKDKNERDKNEEFTFNELVSEIKKDGNTTNPISKAERLQQFMNYLNVEVKKP